MITRRQIAELKRLRQEMQDRLRDAELEREFPCLLDDLADFDEKIERKVKEEGTRRQPPSK